MTLCPNERQRCENDGNKPKQARNGLVWPNPSIDFDGAGAGLIGVQTVDIAEFDDEAVLPRIDAEAELLL